jgi:UDP-N-acetylglucosamine/UDP-N-acetylgalactosamine diphosphorylase
MNDHLELATKRLLDAGVRLPAPHTIWVDPEIPPEQIAPGVVIHPGCRLVGAATSIGPGCVLGREGPLTLENTQLQAGVQLGGGYLAGATLLAGANLGADAHVRPGTLLEEQATGGHAVGLKQTLLMPFVTTGSLVNFCDCLMAGGTSRDHHSEVGSSYVHFNFTPQQDKATPSRIGDVPQGVMLDQPPIFLGGQGGLVGPAHIAYGTVVAAGTVLRGDVVTGGRLVFGRNREGEHQLEPGLYRNARRIVAHNLTYLGNLQALRLWYQHAREPFMAATPFDAAAHAGALRRLDEMLAERLKRLDGLVTRLQESIRIGAALPSVHAATPDLRFQADFSAAWPRRREALLAAPVDRAGTEHRDRLLAALTPQSRTTSYLDAIRSLDASSRLAGTQWLQDVVNTVASAGENP